MDRRRTIGACRHFHSGHVDFLGILADLRTGNAHRCKLTLQIRALAHQLAGYNVSLGDSGHVHTAGVEAVVVINHIECAVILDHIGIANARASVQQNGVGPGLSAILGQESGQIVSAAKVLVVDHEQLAAAGLAHIDGRVGVRDVGYLGIGPGLAAVIGEALLHIAFQLTQQHP